MILAVAVGCSSAEPSPDENGGGNPATSGQAGAPSAASGTGTGTAGGQDGSSAGAMVVGGAPPGGNGGNASGGSGGSGGQGKGGTAGAAGNPAAGAGGGTAGAGPKSLVTGFASTASNGLTTTTGGGNAAPNTVTTCDDLRKYLSDAQARVIEIPSGTTLDCRTAPRTQQACELQCSKDAATPVFWRIPVGDMTCTSLADTNGDGTLDIPAGKLVNKERREVSMKVGSNKTLRGLGSGATLLGVSLSIEKQSNIIVQNLKISEINPDLVEAGDGITINESHHVWVDHCELSMISDGYLDIRYGSSAVTVSHNRIVGKNQYVCGGQHHYISLVSDAEVTFNNNYFDHPSGRNPKVSDASKVHLYSNFYDSVSYFCTSSGAGSEILVEGNYYRDSRYPHWADGGSIEATKNQYAGTTSAEHRDSNGSVFDPPYAYELLDVSKLPQTIPASAGVGKL
jgi:pectate lyase